MLLTEKEQEPELNKKLLVYAPKVIDEVKNESTTCNNRLDWS